jgi:hypothetical protein
MILAAQEVPNFLKYGSKNEEDRENSAKDGLKHTPFVSKYKMF